MQTMTRRWFLALAALPLVAVACLGAQDAATVPVEKYAGTIRVACVGDSITYGAGVKDRDTNCYPARLGRMLGDKWEVRNFGVSGATMLRKGDKPYDKQKAYEAALACKPDVLIIALGTNDTKPRNWQHQADFAGDYRAMIGAFRKANPDVRVYVCLPVPAFPGNWGIDDGRIREGVIPLVRQVAEAEKAAVIDLYAALEGKKDLVPDKVHPNAEGAALMAAAVFRTLTGKEPAPAAP